MVELKISKFEEILEDGIKKLLTENKVQSLCELIEKIGFSAVLINIEAKAYEIYRERERSAVKEVLENKNIPSEMAEKIIRIFIDESLATRIANIRRVRGGLTAESILRKVLREAEIPCEKCKIKVAGYRADIAVPSNSVLKSCPEKAVAIAVKRTLRERWAEDTNLFRKFKRAKFVLLTPDPDFNEEKAKDMIERGMKEIYIPDELYEKCKDFAVRYSELKKHSQLIPDIKQIIAANTS